MISILHHEIKVEYESFRIDLLNKHCQCDFITEAEAYEIINGNVSEDRNLFKMIIRLWNQHFYNPIKPREFWLRDKSIDVRFERISKRWFAGPDVDKDFSSIGEIVHQSDFNRVIVKMKNNGCFHVLNFFGEDFCCQNEPFGEGTTLVKNW